MVWYLNGDLNSGHFVTIFLPSKYYEPGIWLTNDLNAKLLKVCYSDVYIFQILVIQIPTVSETFDPRDIRIRGNKRVITVFQIHNYDSSII